MEDTEIQKQISRNDYKGCNNCKNQISPLRSCKWAEHGGDGRIHLICPMWDKKEESEEERWKNL